MVEYDTRVQYLKGVGENRAKELAKLGIFSVGSLLRYYPRTYEDWSKLTPLKNAPENETVCIRAMVTDTVQESRTKGNKLLSKTFIADGSGYVTLVFFNNKYVKNLLVKGEEYLFYGKLTRDANGGVSMLAPRFEAAPEKQRIRPVYKASAKLNSKTIERFTSSALSELSACPDPIPEYLIKRYKLMPLKDALRAIHFPESEKELALAKRRLIFEELFVLQLALLKKRSVSTDVKSVPIQHDYSDEFYSLLPFEPTNAQKRCVKEAMNDLLSKKPMNRLLQGDVGSGKTAVAAAIMYSVAKNGAQSVLMAPTEVLATQHYKTLKGFFGDSLNIRLLTGSVTAKNKREIKALLKEGECDIVVGTHAVIQNDVEFKKLSLVITDEQHRFGVAQRATLAGKGTAPNVLVMSATPIPRTLAMIIYGDLDVSVIDELPKGRKPVKTFKVNSGYHERIFKFLKKAMDSGRQCYIVCPLVTESENGGDLMPATEYYDFLKSTYLGNYTLGLLYGSMKPKEKDEVMRRFYANEIQCLISTVVIEVGVDVPNATVMAIENAERFGLSQLHQLRGRIGRGSDESTCILISDAQKEESEERFKILCETNDGFVIAKRDLELRGPGDFFGSRQHGLPDMHIANLMTDTRILYEAQKVTKEIIDKDPHLTLPEHVLLNKEADRMFAAATV